MLPETKTLFEAGNKKIYEQSGYYVDSTFFEVFPLSLKYGTSVKALDDISSIVLSQEMAQRFFGNENPVGKQMLMDKVPYQVKAVFKKNPKFHLQFNYLLPLPAAQIPAERMQSWGWHQFYTYVKVKQQTNVAALQTKFQSDVKQKAKTLQNDAHSSDKPFFQSLKDIHLYSSDFKFDAAQRGNITYVNALTIIAIFVLLIACFNFINLATAKSLQRAKEVGVRKSIGAKQKTTDACNSLAKRFCLAFISVFISVILSIILLPWLNDFTGKNISLHYL